MLNRSAVHNAQPEPLILITSDTFGGGGGGLSELEDLALKVTETWHGQNITLLETYWNWNQTGVNQGGNAIDRSQFAADELRETRCI